MITENRITEGIIWKGVIALFIPIVISSFFQHLYSIVDGMIVGAYLGTVAFSAVGGSASKIITMLINFFVGVSAGITAYTARYYGKGDMHSVKKVILNGMLFFTVFGIILAILGIVFSEHILRLMGTPVETFALSNVYLITFLYGLIFCVAYNTLTGILRALGDSKTPLYVLVFCSFLNIGLDLLFVVVLSWGVQGVAVATLIAQGVSAVLLGGIVCRRLVQEKQITEKRVTLDFKMIGEICAIGIPAGLQSMMYSLSNILVQSAVNSFGYITVAAWSAYLKIDSIVDIIVSALGSTVITYVGQNMGAGKINRVKESVKTIILISYGVTVMLILCFVTFRFQLLGLFVDDVEVIDIGSKLFFIIMPMYLLGIPQTMLVKALQGLGKSFVPMILTIVGVIGVRVLWVLVMLPMNESIYFLGLCYPISAGMMSIIFTIYYRKEIKKEFLEANRDSSSI